MFTTSPPLSSVVGPSVSAVPALARRAKMLIGCPSTVMLNPFVVLTPSRPIRFPLSQSVVSVRQDIQQPWVVAQEAGAQCEQPATDCSFGLTANPRDVASGTCMPTR